MSSVRGAAAILSLFVLIFLFSRPPAGMYGHHLQQSIDQTGKIVNPYRGQLYRELLFYCDESPFAPDNLASCDGFGRPVPACPISTLRLNLVLAHGISREVRGGVDMLESKVAFGLATAIHRVDD